jgi:transposase
LLHREEAQQFYRKLQEQGLEARVGMESSGHSRWFERLLRELQLELWIGDTAAIRTKRVRKQKTDRQDARLLLRLMMEDRFPRIWVPDAANRDLRQLLWHRRRRMRLRSVSAAGALRNESAPQACPYTFWAGQPKSRNNYDKLMRGAQYARTSRICEERLDRGRRECPRFRFDVYHPHGNREAL